MIKQIGILNSSKIKQFDWDFLNMNSNEKI